MSHTQENINGLPARKLELVHIFRSQSNFSNQSSRFKFQRHNEEVKQAMKINQANFLFNVYPDPSEKIQKAENYVGLLYKALVYVPFNPCQSQNDVVECRKEISTKTGEPFYILPKIDPALNYTLPCGKNIPLYRWAQRRWLFSRFDEGIQLTADGFTDVTPEPVAHHIAQTMRDLLSNSVNGGEISEKFDSNSPETRQAFSLYKEDYPLQQDSLVSPKTQLYVPDTTVSLPNVLDRRSSKPSMQNILLLQDSFMPLMPKINGLMHQYKNSLGDHHNDSSKNNKKREITSEHSSEVSQDDHFFPSLNGCCVIEACCGFGGNTIQLASSFHYVWAIERDTKRIEMAQINAKIYGLTNINWVKEDFYKWYEREYKFWVSHSADWFFASPPWGGQDYKKDTFFSLNQDIFGCHLFDMAVLGSTLAHNVALYLPPNQDLAELVYLTSKMKGFHLIYLENISIGLTKKTKFRVVYFLKLTVSLGLVPNLLQRIANLYTIQLQEKSYMSPWFIWLLQELGVQSTLYCLACSISKGSYGDVKINDSELRTRTRGGVFFSTLKHLFPESYRKFNKLT